MVRTTRLLRLDERAHMQTYYSAVILCARILL